MRCAEPEHVTVKVADMHQGPVIDNVFADSEVVIAILNDGRGHGGKVGFGIAVTQPAKMAPHFAPQMTACAMTEESVLFPVQKDKGVRNRIRQYC